MPPILKIATRKSPLALKQVELVIEALALVEHRFLDSRNIEIVSLQTSGDAFQHGSLKEIGGKGLFTKELDEALLEGRVDIAVHSAKDMQTTLPDGLMMAAVLPREDVRDVLVSHSLHTLNTLAQGAKIGTASLRRAQILKDKRSDFHIEPIRGNLATRLRKVEDGQFDATILALAGLKRLGVAPLPGTILELDEMLPAPAQGIIAIQCRTNDAETIALLEKINHTQTMAAATIERAILAALDGSCKTPIAAYVEHTSGGVSIRAMLGDEHIGKVVYADACGSEDDATSLVDQIVQKLKSAIIKQS